jgi:hypothetical protein
VVVDRSGNVTAETMIHVISLGLHEDCTQGETDSLMELKSHNHAFVMHDFRRCARQSSHVSISHEEVVRQN